jgi:predicted nucleic acid-binding protein
MIIVDTSVWIEVFRAKNPLDLESLVAFDDVVTCLPIVQEVLQGFRDEQAFRLARESMAALPTVESPLGSAVFDEAVDLYRLARRAGLTVRSSVDCLIAACAVRNGLEIVHRDRDFEALERISALRVRRV